MNENEAKEEARKHKGEDLDSVELTIGTPAKGTAVKIKHYYNAKDEEAMNLKHKRIIQARQLYLEQNIIRL